MFLVDTNVWLELLLSRQRANEVRKFFQATDASQLAISEFSLYSLGVILTRLKKAEVFDDFLSDVIEDSGVTRIRLTANELRQVLEDMQQFRMDFDDAYQYVAATHYGYILVSFDKDFDRTKIKRQTPKRILQKLKK
jgi:hypothetical protein